MSDDTLDLSTDEAQDDDSTAGEEQKGGLSIKEKKEFNKKAIDRRLDALRYTRQRIEEAEDDELVMQKLEGDVMVEVPPERREEVLEKIESTIERLEETKNVETG